MIELDNLRTVPSLFVVKPGEPSTRVMLTLTRATTRFVIRLTGGCGNMTQEYAAGVCELLSQALAGFSGALLFGGTRMLMKDNLDQVFMGITEVAPIVREHCPNAIVLGVVPRTADLQVADYGMVVSEEPGNPYVTIIHPNQTLCVLVQIGPDHDVPWEAEFEECGRITIALRRDAGWDSLLISYNGGGTTKKEILAHADAHLPMLLIDESGGWTEKFARDQDFLAAHPEVRVAKPDVGSIRRELWTVGAIPPDGEKRKLRMVR